MNKFITLLATVLVSSTFTINAFADTTQVTESESSNIDGSITTTTITETTADPVITAKVREVYGPEMSTVVVETKDGIVYLTGKLKSQADIERAIASARTVPGVKNVDSKIVIEEVTTQ